MNRASSTPVLNRVFMTQRDLPAAADPALRLAAGR